MHTIEFLLTVIITITLEVKTNKISIIYGINFDIFTGSFNVYYYI